MTYALSHPLRPGKLIPALCLLLCLAVGSLSPASQAASRGSNDRPVGDAYDNHWLHAGRANTNTRALIAALEGATLHGLDPEHYGLSQLQQQIAGLSDRRPPAPPALTYPQRHAALTAEMDRAFGQLLDHLAHGVVDGHRVEKDMFHTPPAVNVEELTDALRRGRLTVSEALNSVTPMHADYRRLQAHLRTRLDELARIRELPWQIEDVVQEDRPAPHADTPLIATGLIPDAPLIDTGLAQLIENPINRRLQADRRRHRLLPIELGERGQIADASWQQTFSQTEASDSDAGGDGGEDSDTGIHRVSHARNANEDIFDTKDDRERQLLDEIRALSLSLERWRWMPRDLGDRHVLVNVPDFRVSVRQGNSVILSMPVVVGDTAHPTPSFSRAMSYMEFNPTWTVPASIANSKLIPKERAQPGYLQARGFEVLGYRDGRLVRLPDYRFNSRDLNRDRFPHVLRQRGGPGNALGQIKFMMPNRHAIYLHDTPSKHHFSLPVRAYSHGCIRVSEPHALARVLLQADGHSSRAIEKMLARQTTHRVSLRRPVPTHLAYLTSWVDSEGELQRRADIYQRDTDLLRALEEAETLPGLLASPGPEPSTVTHIAARQ